MTNDQGQRRVILIFGDPCQGKTTLAKQLQDKYGYLQISLDNRYVDFIKNRYPGLFLPDLREVIEQHYNSMFAQDPGRVAAWCEHVVSVTMDASSGNALLAVEGYLLAPALKMVEQSIAGLATVRTVEVRNGQYFVASSIEQIHIWASQA